MESESDIQRQATRLLTGVVDHQNDPGELITLLYQELRNLANQMMNSERANHTLQPTALVHETFMKLIIRDGLEVTSQDHFFMLAARVMRDILIDHARSTNRIKRGRDRNRVPLTIVDPDFDDPIEPSDLLAINEALEQLRGLDERKARVVELRFFGGLDEEVTARVLGISRSTASNDWRFARAWLLNKLRDDQGFGRDG